MRAARIVRAAGLALLAATVLPAAAQSVSLAGHMGSKALLMIDGQPQTLAVGERVRGVRLLRLEAGEAQVERDGRVLLLRSGATPASVGTAPDAASAAREIVIPGGPGGHFVASGSINGRAARFMVDTGATLITLGREEAQRLGIDWQRGQPGLVQTANGNVESHTVSLARVRVGEVEIVNVAAIVVPAAMPQVLLGNSFLSRFQMRREADVMRLVPR